MFNLPVPRPREGLSWVTRESALPPLDHLYRICEDALDHRAGHRIESFAGGIVHRLELGERPLQLAGAYPLGAFTEITKQRLKFDVVDELGRGFGNDNFRFLTRGRD